MKKRAIKKREEQEPGRGWMIRVSLERLGAPTGFRTIALGTSEEIGATWPMTPEAEANGFRRAHDRWEAALEAARSDP